MAALALGTCFSVHSFVLAVLALTPTVAALYDQPVGWRDMVP